MQGTPDLLEALVGFALREGCRGVCAAGPRAGAGRMQGTPDLSEPLVGFALCDGCRACAQLDRALGLARQMRARGVRGNVFSYSALLNVCVKCGQLDAGLEVWSEMERSSVPLNARPRHLRTCAWLRGGRIGGHVWSLAACIAMLAFSRKLARSRPRILKTGACV